MPTRHVAFVRAVMIGRDGLHRDVLLDLFRSGGAVDPRNHLTTGNVSFTAPADTVPVLVGHVEAGIREIVGRPKLLFVRTVAHLEALVADDPFRAAPFHEPDEREVVVLPDDAPSIDLPLVSRSGHLTVFASTGHELCSVSRRAGGRQPEAPGGLVERALGVPVTVRAWSTVVKIVAAASRP